MPLRRQAPGSRRDRARRVDCEFASGARAELPSRRPFRTRQRESRIRTRDAKAESRHSRRAMTRTSRHIARLGVLFASIGAAAAAEQGRTVALPKGATVWTATRGDAERMARVEAGLAAVTLSSGTPIALDVPGWM